jgi:hypothetical protein
LKGRFIDCNHDIGMVLENLKEVEEKRMYELKADKFVEIESKKRRREDDN